MCQQGNDDCGALVAFDGSGRLVARADRNVGLRGWVSAGVTASEDYYYLGTGSGQDSGRSLEGNPRRACSVVRLDRNLRVVAGYDDGLPGCQDIGRVKSAVVGEVPIADGVMVAQYLGSTDGTQSSPVVRLREHDLSVICRAALPNTARGGVAGFYQAPVIDEHGNAYVQSRNPQNGGFSSLFRISPTCRVTRLHDGSAGHVGTPTLADDQYVVYGDTGRLHVVDRTTGRATDYPLGSSAEVIAGAVISEWGVTVVSKDNTVTTVRNTGLDGYGTAPWPRFRRTDLGEAFEP